MFGHADCAACASEERLFHKLFSHYNQFIRPVENVSDPVTVHFEVAITQLANVVSASSSLHVPQEALSLRGSEQFSNIVPLIACGKYGNQKNANKQKSTWPQALRSCLVGRETLSSWIL